MFLILCILILLAYAIFIERKLLIVKNFSIERKNLKKSKKIKIAHITDIHIGKYFSLGMLEKLVEKINSSNPDIVVLTGDLFDRLKYYDSLDKVSQILSKIDCTSYKFSVYGNHDSYPGNRYSYSEIMKDSGFTLLINENEKINFNDKSINIMGLDDFFQGKINVEKTVENISNDDFNLLLLHEPDLIDNFKNYNIDLALAGHSHGGQISLPLIGPLAHTGLAKKYDKGFYNLGTNNQIKLYAHTGIGNTRIPVRFGNIPHIALFEIYL